MGEAFLRFAGLLGAMGLIVPPSARLFRLLRGRLGESADGISGGTAAPSTSPSDESESDDEDDDGDFFFFVVCFFCVCRA